MFEPKLTVLNADVTLGLSKVIDQSVACVVTSPPYYGLRSYLKDNDPSKSLEIGQETNPQLYIARLVEVFREVRRVLRDDGVLWLNLGDSYANDTKWGGKTSGKHATALHGDTGIGRRRTSTGLKSKDMVMIPPRVALALQADGWYLRAACPWIKRNAMPQSVNDRPTTAIEYIYMLTKSEHYFYDGNSVELPAICSRMRGPAEHADKISTNGNSGLSRRKPKTTRKRRASDWFLDSMGLLQDEVGGPLAFVVNTSSYRGAHFATFPAELITPCIQSTSRRGDTVLDIFSGSGTVGQVALELQRYSLLIELNPSYIPLIHQRCFPAQFRHRIRHVFQHV